MDKAVSQAKDRLNHAIANALEQALREKCGIHLTERQREKLYGFIEFELNP